MELNSVGGVVQTSAEAWRESYTKSVYHSVYRQLETAIQNEQVDQIELAKCVKDMAYCEYLKTLNRSGIEKVYRDFKNNQNG